MAGIGGHISGMDRELIDAGVHSTINSNYTMLTEGKMPGSKCRKKSADNRKPISGPPEPGQCKFCFAKMPISELKKYRGKSICGFCWEDRIEGRD